MKQYLLLCDEHGMNILKHTFRESTVQFLEVQGINLNSENKLNILVTPVTPPVTQAVVLPPTPPAPEEEDAPNA